MGNQKIATFLLARGEFRVFNALMLISLYGSAILSIPMLLGSFLQLSSVLLQLQEKAYFAPLLSSISSEARVSYFYVEIALFLGFVAVCFLSGVSLGRNAKTFEFALALFGAGKKERTRSIALVIFLVALVCALLSFALAFVFSSIAIYAISLAIHGAYLIPAVSFDLAFYLILIIIVVTIFLGVGWSRVRVLEK
ncbi:MAG: hypothetical protein ACYCQJ_03700 [Nitrososphaerales archaeon]